MCLIMYIIGINLCYWYTNYIIKKNCVGRLVHLCVWYHVCTRICKWWHVYVFLMCSVCVMYMCCIRIVQVYGLSHSWIHMYAVPVYTPDLCLFSCDCTYTNICIDVKLLIHMYICCGHVDLYEYLYKDTTICTYIEKRMSYFTAFQSFVNIHGFFYERSTHGS